ncbi:YHS domain-containing (seleno)protein [Albidovulum sediminis]|uniref:YHS domain protein n=1 Tax=Albidovulum sediminis TaxID=3066345 RepID=A0ABT2NKM0_9RHOB|nr:YHS domain-containing (seleno)protein [Defluviimonas sediminis]MCT8328070.1 YHS domain protein [Defluviimonas sediminis]
MSLSRRAILAAVIAIPVAGTILRPALAKESAVYAPQGVALGGYDVTAYFTEGRAVQGTSRHEIMWHGAVWRFASAQSLMEFEMNPAAYAPQYGGYCAFSASKGSIAAPMPEAFAVRDGKLYLTHNMEMLALWNEDPEGNIALADRNWPAVIGQ